MEDMVTEINNIISSLEGEMLPEIEKNIALLNTKISQAKR